jgi:hypothetical protein
LKARRKRQRDLADRAQAQLSASSRVVRRGLAADEDYDYHLHLHIVP